MFLSYIAVAAFLDAEDVSFQLFQDEFVLTAA